ncbi:MAG TPA: efflux RND transporter periplasmic adaptor subunit, partial [Candidatus Krumholzibacterium sp.]|nr:efflux RND transporter periplasmic adaptor subunit [Candidatus Krumholzibacterium sp.]
DHGTDQAEGSGHDHGLAEAEESGHDHGAEEVEGSGHDHGEETDADAHAGEVAGGETGDVHAEDEGQIVHMTEENMKKFGIELKKAGPGIFEIPRKAQGEIVLNADRSAHIVPRVSGITVEVLAGLGDKVEKGDLLAVIESPDLADAKAAYLASVERLGLAKAVFQREERLRSEGISSESEFLDAKRGFAEAGIGQRSAQQKLLALGIRGEDLKGLSSAPAEEFARYEVRAPLAGTVIRKHLATGETVAADSEIFQISCLDTVWADLRIYQSDVGLIRAGQEVVISKNQGTPIFGGLITYVDPVIDSRTRTALARVVLDNSSGTFNPGTFISAEIISEKRAAALVVERSTIQEVGGEPCVFVWDGHGFVLRPVVLGHTSGQYAEIVSGLSAGEMIASTNSFRLKAELTTSENASCSAHGHAH